MDARAAAKKKLTHSGEKPLIKGRKAARTRKKLLDAGVKLFAGYGYSGASTRQIEAEAGVHRNLITYHFGNKDEFWKACMSHLLDPLVEELQRVVQATQRTGSGLRLRVLIEQYLRVSGAHPEVNQILVEEGKRDDWRLKWIVENYVSGFYEMAVGLYAEAKQLGLAPDIGPIGFYYVLTGSSAIFSMAPECRQLTGRDPRSDDLVADYAASVAKLLIRDPTKVP